MIDLDAERDARAAAREGRAEDGPVKIGGKVVATLPVEMPIDAFAPLRNLDGDLTLILQQSMTAAKNRGSEQGWDATNMVIDLLAANPALPSQVLDTFREVLERLLTPEGFEGYLEARPSVEDYVALSKGIFAFYGVTLGEAFSSSGLPSGDQGTSSTTSSDTSDSTTEESGSDQTSPASLEPAAS